MQLRHLERGEEAGRIQMSQLMGSCCRRWVPGRNGWTVFGVTSWRFDNLLISQFVSGSWVWVPELKLSLDKIPFFFFEKLSVRLTSLGGFYLNSILYLHLFIQLLISEFSKVKLPTEFSSYCIRFASEPHFDSYYLNYISMRKCENPELLVLFSDSWSEIIDLHIKFARIFKQVLFRTWK